MTTLIKSILTFSFILGLCQYHSYAETTSFSQPQFQQVSPTNPIRNNVTDNMSQLVFIRFADHLPPTTNVNLYVDDDYQASLASNHISNVMVCKGKHLLNIITAAQKTNKLSLNPISISTKAGQTHYYQLWVSDTGVASIKPLSPKTEVNKQPLTDYLKTLSNQSHQISRVSQDCPKAVSVPTPIVIPAPVIFEPVPIPAPPALPTPIVFNTPIELDVLFKFDSATVVPQYYTRLAELANFVNTNKASVVIDGHTDSTGSRKYNMTLSKKRAEAIKAILIKKYGVSPVRITTRGFGETRPVASNNTPEGRRQNRRVISITLRK